MLLWFQPGVQCICLKSNDTSSAITRNEHNDDTSISEGSVCAAPRDQIQIFINVFGQGH